ncbi:MAG: hypothetical protein JWP21_1134 [Tardiphaga sp.]|nr:hypothetical protein [Tardiphaga sp.]
MVTASGICDAAVVDITMDGHAHAAIITAFRVAATAAGNDTCEAIELGNEPGSIAVPGALAALRNALAECDVTLLAEAGPLR